MFLAIPCRVHDADLDQLFNGQKCISEEETRLTLKFTVKGQEGGDYSAVIAMYQAGLFHLDAVYRDSPNPCRGKVRINIALPGRYVAVIVIIHDSLGI